MERKKIMTIFGTRPEAIKMAPLIKQLKKSEFLEIIVCVTAQHREILDQVLDLFDIAPDYDLNIMKTRQTLAGITSMVINGLDEVFEKEKPDMVLVHGDTTTTFAASLAAYYHQIKVGHVEAGLRSFEKYFPYPEELNRRLTGCIADLHFSPTEVSKNNLYREGIEKDVYITGNTVIDAMEYTVEPKYVFDNENLNKIDFGNKKIVMVTAHRRENWGEGIDNICTVINKVSEMVDDVEFVYLVHPNPIVKEAVEKHLGKNEKVHLLAPLDTKDTHNLMNRCYLVMTDSGGLQEEAPHLGKPVLILRDVTERPEAIKYGTAKLVGTEASMIYSELVFLLQNNEAYNEMSHAVNPYGDGRASNRIVQIIEKYYDFNNDVIEEFIV